MDVSLTKIRPEHKVDPLTYNRNEGEESVKYHYETAYVPSGPNEEKGKI